MIHSRSTAAGHAGPWRLRFWAFPQTLPLRNTHNFHIFLSIQKAALKEIFYSARCQESTPVITDKYCSFLTPRSHMSSLNIKPSETRVTQETMLTLKLHLLWISCRQLEVLKGFFFPNWILEVVTHQICMTLLCTSYIITVVVKTVWLSTKEKRFHKVRCTG